MNSSKKISLLVADDHAIVRQGLCGLLTGDGHFLILGQARNGREAVEMTLTLRPDVILMDIAMPVLNGLEATRQILAAEPTAKIVILSAHSDDEYIERLRGSGVLGFLEKQTSIEILSEAIQEVAKGKRFFIQTTSRRLGDGAKSIRHRDNVTKIGRARLTLRESEVLQLVAEGSANKQIAAHLGISIKTVEKHRQHLMDKLNIHDTAGLTRYAIATGVVESNVQLTII